MKKRLASMILIVAVALTMCFSAGGTAFAEDQMNRVNLQVSVDGADPVTVKAYNASYTYNTYVSMKDFCSALTGTDRQMDFRYDEESGDYIVTTGTAYVPAGGENEGFEEAGYTDIDWIDLDAPYFIVDGNRQQYRVYPSGDDAYMKLVDLGLAFGITTELVSKTELTVDTKTAFHIDIDKLDDNGYFSFLHGALVGNADTGEILYSSNADVQTQIASTTKLMTFLLVEEAISAGKLSLDTEVTLSRAVLEEANSEDGTFYDEFYEGQVVTVHDLMAGMLLPSANECATALAEAVSVSEAAFVKQMNARAKKLGLSSAKFYNPHGLPNYDKSSVTAKRQNLMNAEDMFSLVSYILKHYEKELTYFTAKESIDVPTFGEGVTADSTYRTLIWNLGVTGLKTGTTNRSGACIVTLLPVSNNGKEQNIVSVIFGAENNMERYEKSTMLLKYAQQFYAEKSAVNAKTVKASVKAGKSSISVSWKKAGTGSYQVYRAVKKNGTYKKITTSSKLSFTDKNVKKGKTYYYKVRGVKTIDGKKVYTRWSEPVKAECK
ncbi:MAG: serine hydrolase [Emergencia sp.]